MRVLYVSKALVMAAYRDKLRALARHARVTAVVPARWGATEPEPGADNGGVPVRREPALFHGRNHLHLYSRPGRILRAARPDLVHVDEEPYSAVTYQFARACRKHGVPMLFFAWQNLEKRIPPPFGALRAAVFRGAAGAIAGTGAAAAVLRRAGYAGPLATIPQFGVDHRRFRPDAEARRRRRAALGAGPREFVVGYAGRLVREKGVHVLLEAVAAVPGARLVLLGAGPERGRLARDAARAGLGGRVHLPGPVPSLAMPEWIPAFDALALPSLTTARWAEQFGRILVEAMACGVPVVGSDSGEIPRVIGDAGLVVPEGDTAALSAALSALAADPARRGELAARGRARVLERFSNDRIAAETAHFYRTLLETTKGPAGGRRGLTVIRGGSDDRARPESAADTAGGAPGTPARGVGAR